MKGYKRYRVSSQRFSHKPLNIEFVIVLDTRRKSDVSVDELGELIARSEASALSRHPETAMRESSQLTLFELEENERGQERPATRDPSGDSHQHDVA
jgi:hypothetical protein